MQGATYATAVMKVTANGQISIPADVRRRWQTDRVIVIDTSEGLVVRPFDPDHIRSLRGKYRQWVTETTAEARRAAREEEAELEDRRAGARRVRP